tara:strand:- start:1616 stop:1840 length:225 start_codon:yes stop_codon:yes gene_type:complete
MAKQQRTYWPNYTPLGNSDYSDRTLTDNNFGLLRRKGDAIGKHWGQGACVTSKKSRALVSLDNAVRRLRDEIYK